jgi:hypothetical protein
MIKILHNLALICVKNAIFPRIFRRKYLKNHNIGPCLGNFSHICEANKVLKILLP